MTEGWRGPSGKLWGDYRVRPETIPVWVGWFANPTRIARALGVEVDLPDADDETMDWSKFDHYGWKRPLLGKVPEQDINRQDPDWLLLKEFPFAHVWYDLEEGIRFATDVGNLSATVEFIRATNHRSGIPLIHDDGLSLVHASFAVGGFGVPQMDDHLPAKGFVCRGNIWELPC